MICEMPHSVRHDSIDKGLSGRAEIFLRKSPPFHFSVSYLPVIPSVSEESSDYVTNLFFN